MKRSALILLFVAGAVVAFFVAMNTASDEILTDDLVMELAAELSAQSDPDDPPDDLRGETPWEDSLATDSSNFDVERLEVAGAKGAGGRPLEIQVWSGRVGVPAEGAEVFFAEVADWGRIKRGRRADSRYFEHWSEAAVRDGAKFLANTEGRVALPPVKQWAMIAVRRPGEYGFLALRAKHKPVETVLLASDETLSLRVVDGAGKGVAGVPVGVHQQVPSRRNRSIALRNGTLSMQQLRKLLEGNARGRAEEALQQGLVLRIGSSQMRIESPNKNATAKPEFTTSFELRARRQTDADGHAVIRHFQLYRREAKKWWRPQDHDQFQAALLIPTLQPVAVPFVARPLPEESIELRMPATGSVTVRVVDHEGRPFIHPTNAELHVQGEGAVKWTRISARKEQEQRVVEFPFVGLGLQVLPRVWLDDRDFTWNGPVVAGPARAGERVAIDVPASPTFGMLHGRVVDASGKPVSVPLTFLINGKSGRLEGEDLSPGAGRFQLMFQVGRHVAPFTLEIRQLGVQPPVGVVLQLPALENGRSLDLGDVPVAAFGSFARGVVLDDRRQPVVNATVKLQRERDVGGKKPGKAWRDEAFVTARTDAEGKYDLFAAPVTGRYRVQAQARNHFTAQSGEVSFGSKVDLTLVRTANLVGTLLMPKWLPSRSVRVRVDSAVPGGATRNDRARDFKGKKFIFVSNVRPGLYNLSILVTGFPDPVLRVDGIRIEAGMTGVHPLLSDLNLAAFVYRYEITAVDSSGQPMQNPGGPLLARVVRQSGQAQFVGFPWKGTKVEIFSASPQMEIVQLSTGYRVQQTYVSHGASQLRFEKLPPVRLVMPGLRAAVGKDMRVRVSMVLTKDTGLPSSLRVRDQRTGKQRNYSRAQLSKSSGAWLGTTDEVQVPLMRDGEYQVVARLRENGVKSVPVILGNVTVRFTPGQVPKVRVPGDASKIRLGLDEVQRLKIARDQQRLLKQQKQQQRKRR